MSQRNDDDARRQRAADATGIAQLGDGTGPAAEVTRAILASPALSEPSPAVAKVLADLRAAKLPVYDPSDPVQAEAALRFEAEEGRRPRQLHPLRPLPAGEGVAYDDAGIPLSVTSNYVTVPVDTAGATPADYEHRITAARHHLVIEERSAVAGRTFAATAGVPIEPGTPEAARFRMRRARVGARLVEIYHDIRHTPLAMATERADGTWLLDFVDGRDSQVLPSFRRLVELADFHGWMGETPEETPLAWSTGEGIETGTVADLAFACRFVDEMTAAGVAGRAHRPLEVLALREDGRMVYVAWGIAVYSPEHSNAERGLVRRYEVQVTLGVTTAVYSYWLPEPAPATP